MTRLDLLITPGDLQGILMVGAIVAAVAAKSHHQVKRVGTQEYAMMMVVALRLAIA